MKTTRRGMLKLIGGISVGSMLSTMGLGRTRYELYGYTSIESKTDVLVIGGGPAGITAALQAARAGARTILVERGSQLGGNITTGGVSFPGLFDAWGKQIIAGIGWDLVKEVVELDGGTLPDFSKVPDHHWMNQVHINQFLFILLAEEKLREAGVEIAHYEFPQTVTRTDGGWMVDCFGFGTRRRKWDSVRVIEYWAKQ